jgi:hypothetical protein
MYLRDRTKSYCWNALDERNGKMNDDEGCGRQMEKEGEEEEEEGKENTKVEKKKMKKKKEEEREKG